MKGGGFLVFLFLLFCFLWGIAAIVGGLREAVTSWFSRPQRQEPPARPSRPQHTQVQDVTPLRPAPASNSQAPEPEPPPKPDSKAHGNPGTEIKSLFELYQLGALSKEEFEVIKQKILKNHLFS